MFLFHPCFNNNNNTNHNSNNNNNNNNNDDNVMVKLIKNAKSKYFLLLGLSPKRIGLLRKIYIFPSENSKPKSLLNSKWQFNVL